MEEKTTVFFLAAMALLVVTASALVYYSGFDRSSITGNVLDDGDGSSFGLIIVDDDSGKGDGGIVNPPTSGGGRRRPVINETNSTNATIDNNQTNNGTLESDDGKTLLGVFESAPAIRAEEAILISRQEYKSTKPEECQLAPECEVVQDCGEFTQTNTALFSGEPVVSRTQQRLCGFNDCNYVFVRHEACPEIDKADVDVLVEKIDVLPGLDGSRVEDGTLILSGSSGSGETRSISVVSHDTQETLVVATLREKKLYVELEPSREDLCFNGVQDDNEQGIDCGGDCKECYSKGWDFARLFKYFSWVIAGAFLIAISLQLRRN